MRIGEIAGRAGVPAKTIRFWEEQGLLDASGRATAGDAVIGSVLAHVPVGSDGL